MSLRLYDTLRREKRDFTPIDPSNVRMYVCGPTVYDYAHIGNARPVIVFDVLFRLLRHLYGAEHVTYVRNITDVDDKINDRALRDYPGLPLNDAIRKVTEKTEAQFQADVTALGCLPPTHQPRATDFVLPRSDGKADMVTLIRQLITRGHAYEAAGEVLFDTQSMPDYGQLSGRKLDEQKSGARIAVDAHKKSPGDFVLWKRSSPDEPGWDSPWGRGRPGWHIECSAMSAAYLGQVFDIHGGGLDLIFPHHENEIAQSRCAHGTPAMANYWMHNGFLQVEGEKMSKSLGNFVTIRELLNNYTGDGVRLNMLMTHYRQPIDWTKERLREAENKVHDWYRALPPNSAESEPDSEFLEALADDLNTVRAIARIDEMFREARLSPHAAIDEKKNLWSSIKASACRLGLLEGSFETNLQSRLARQTRFELTWDETLQPRIEQLISNRSSARARKDFRESDRIRDELASMGVVLKDGKDADGKPVTTWEIAR